MAAQASTAQLGLDELKRPETFRAAFGELLGTALLVFFGVGAVASFVSSSGQNSALIDGVPVIALSFGLVVGLLVAGLVPISGGHINPAVTFALVITGRTSVARGLVYVVFQLAGAAIGMALLRAFITDDVIFAIPGAGGDSINAAVVTKPIYALGLEAVATFLLVWTVFATAVTSKGSGNVAPLFIGLAVVVAHLVLIPLTGCGINPARTFGPELIDNRWGDWWVYWFGPLIGAGLAGITYFVLYLSAETGHPGSTETA